MSENQSGALLDFDTFFSENYLRDRYVAVSNSISLTDIAVKNMNVNYMYKTWRKLIMNKAKNTNKFICCPTIDYFTTNDIIELNITINLKHKLIEKMIEKINDKTCWECL
jgi:hypothetical protein